MKLSFTLTTFLLLAISASTAQAYTFKSKDAKDQLQEVQAQMQRYETPIIQAWLARSALGGSVETEFGHTQYLFDQLVKATSENFPQPDQDVNAFLGTKTGKAFNLVGPFPPATSYNTPVVLAKDAALDKPNAEGGYPMGRQPQDYANVLNVVSAN